jgi:putative ABC transport system permease protein
MWYPVVQSITTAVLGTALAASLYFASQITINSMFAQYLAEGEYVCRLSPAHLMLSLILTILLSILAAGFAAFRVAKIEPSKVIRDV